MPEEALFVHLSSLPKHVASKGRCYTKSPFRLAWSSLPPLCSLILLSNYFQDHELWESCRSRLLGSTTVACGAGRCGIYFGAFSRVWLCLRACTCTHILWFRPLCITCLTLKMPSPFDVPPHHPHRSLDIWRYACLLLAFIQLRKSQQDRVSWVT